VFAIGDWVSRTRDHKELASWRRVEYVCKPATLVALVVAAATLDPGAGDGEMLAVWDIHDPAIDGYRTEISTGLWLPPWANHIAFNSVDVDDLKVRLERWIDYGLDCVRIDHGWCTSIYADDPNGITVEFCTSTRELTRDDREKAAALLAAAKPALGTPPEVEFFTKV